MVREVRFAVGVEGNQGGELPDLNVKVSQPIFESSVIKERSHSTRIR